MSPFLGTNTQPYMKGSNYKVYMGWSIQYAHIIMFNIIIILRFPIELVVAHSATP